MESSKLAQLMADARYRGIHSFADLVEKYCDLMGIKIRHCEDCMGSGWGPVVHDHVWKRMVPMRADQGTLLCKKCMELRFHRPFKKLHYKVEPWNVFGGWLYEGEIMANRNIQAKRLKIAKARKTLPRYLSAEAVRVGRYNSTSPYAMKTRQFEKPDTALLREGDNGEYNDDNMGLEFGVIPESLGKTFNNVTLARVHTNLDRSLPLEATAFEEWQSWKLKGCTQYNRMVLLDIPNVKLVEVYFSGPKAYLIEEDYVNNTHRKSSNMGTVDRAREALNGRTVYWAKCFPLKPR